MTATDDILASLPIDQLAQQLGADPADVQRAVSAAVPALLGGLGANAQDGGADSLLHALGQHDDSLFTGGVNLDDVDTGDGSRIAGHIFGSQEDAVVSQLSGLPAASSGGSLGGDLIKKLIPILAPIVLSYLAGKIFGNRGGASSEPASVPSTGGGALPRPSGSSESSAGQSGGPGSLQDMLQDVLGGAVGGATGSSSSTGAGSGGGASSGGLDAGSIITDILGGLLGGGRR